MKFYIATDHAGVDLKDYTVELLKQKGHEVVDLGPFDKERVDYPDYAVKVAQSVLTDTSSQGILICGSGIGMSMAANRFHGSVRHFVMMHILRKLHASIMMQIFFVLESVS